MRILIHGINFSPELTGIGKYTGEMVDWLVRHGYDVRVVTAPPYYPEWKIGSGYSGRRYRRERVRVGEGTVSIWRCPLWVPRKPSGAKRLLHLGSFAISSAPVMLAQATWRPHLVVAVAPTLFSAPAALLTARLAGARAWLHVQDFEVDAAFDMGMLKSRGARRGCLAVEGALLRRFDRVSTISERMLDRLADKGVRESRRVLLPNWADIDSLCPLDRPSIFRAELGLADDQVVALYAGNLGEKQGLEILIEAVRQTQHDPRALWVIAGSGSARARLEQLALGLPNLRWLPLQPLERLNDLLNLADIHVLPQRADAADLVMPSKLTGMLASGRPVVATAAAETQVGRVVPHGGVRVAPGDANALAQAVLELVDDPARRRRLGRAAREYAEANLGYDAIMADFEREALSLVSGAERPLAEEQ